MGKSSNKENKENIQKLINLFEGELCINNRNYYENLKRLDENVSKYKSGIRGNALKISKEDRKQYYQNQRETLEEITIEVDQSFLQSKFKKYNLTEEDFPKFRNEQLNLLLNTKPSEAGANLEAEALIRHSIITQVQETFFKFQMRKQKEELQTWLSNQGNQDRPRAEPAEELNEEGLTLNQQILVADLDGTLAAAEEFYGDKVHLALSRKWNRPANKIAECLKKLNGPAKDLENSVAYQKDLKIAEAFVKKHKPL